MKGGRLARAAALALGLLVPAAALAGHNATAITAFSGAGKCTDCHGVGTTQLNGAFSDATVLNHIFDNTRPAFTFMECAYAQGLSNANRIAIANWLKDIVDGTADDTFAPPYNSKLFTISNTFVGANAQKTDINTGTLQHITAGGYAFSHIETVSITPGAGSITWSGSTGTYTPPGYPSSTFVGDVTFTYRGRDTRDGRNIFGHLYSGTMRVGAAPVINSSLSPAGTVGTPLSYTVTSTNFPSFSYGGVIPTGTSRTNQVVSGTPTAAGNFGLTVQATNSLGVDNETVTFAIGKGTPVISFSATQPDQTYAPSPSNTFSLTNLATFTNSTANAQILPTYTSITPTICTTPGTTSTTVTIVQVGLCRVQASFAGNLNWNPAAVSPITDINIVKRSQTITFNPAVPSSYDWSSGGSFTISPEATTDAAVQAGIAITYGVTAGSSTVCSVPVPSVASVNVLTAGSCVITANEDGNNNYLAAAQKTQTVTINAVAPSIPTIGLATAGDTQASIEFTGSTTNGGRPISTYTATCVDIGAVQPTRTGNSLTSPITVINLVNTVTYSCSVTATNQAALTSGASGTVNVTPQPTPVPPNITSANNTTFTVGVPGSFNITATGVPAPTISIAVAPPGLPAGITFSGPGTSPQTLSGTPASGTFGNYSITITADGTNPDATQPFTLTIAKRSQTVSMVDPPDSLFGTGNVALSATATSGMAVSFTSLTPAICGISGTSATLLNVGTCTIQGTQAGDIDWAASTPAAGDTQSFTISAGPQTITFGTQVPATRVIVPGQTFNLNPAATTTSPLTVTYSTSTTPTVCTAMGGIAIRMDNVGTCTIVASQSGNAQYQAATPVQQDVSLTIASQVVTFPAQAPQPYLLGGTFGISPAASADSGLPVTYSSDTEPICTVTGSTVNIVAVGTCTLRATQAGTNNYNPATATADVAIQAVVPKAPTIGAVTGGNQHAKVNFTPPADNGGTAITGYVATCDGITGNGASSPVTVTGLTNNQAYTCSVAAVNAVGTGASSGTANVTPTLMGGTLWTNNCSSCHGVTPNGARFNYAGSSLSTQVLDYVIATNPEMAVLPQLQALNSLERLDLKAYISGFLAAISESTNPNLPKTISVGSHLSLNTVFQGGAPGSFSHVVVDTQPTNGTLSVFNGVEVVYTPNPGYTGPDSFSYHGQRTSPTVVTGDTHTVTINVTAAAPLLTVGKTGTGTGLVFSDTPTSGIDCGTDCSEAYNAGVLVSLVAVANPGTTFIGWTGDCTGASPVCNVTMSAARNVTAVFDLTPFDLTVARSGAGTGTVTSSPAGVNCGATCIAGFPPGTVVTLTPTPAAGSAFTGWSGACTGAGACNVTMDAAKGVTANFEPTYVLSVAKSGTGTGTVSSSPAGVDCGATCSAEFLTGTVVTLTPTAAVGSAFTGWSGACTGMGACSVTMTVARSVTADFTPTHTLSFTKLGNGSGTVSSNPAGINSCGTACSADYLDGTVVTLAATIGPDTEFLGWGGACSGTGACSVTMSAARSVTANFKSSIALTVNRIGTGSGVVTSAPDGVGISCGASCTVGFDPGTVVTLGVSPAAGSVFAGWSGACTGNGACILTMSQSRSVTATFNLASGPLADVSIVSHGSTPPAAASVGQQVTFTLTVANNGPSAATAVVLTDNIPAGSTFVSASPACSHAAGVVTCALGTLASGASLQLDVTVQPTAAGGATNFASVAAAESDPLSFNNASALAISVTGASNVRLGNISTRMQVQGGAGVLIGGFVIGGSSSKTVAIVVTGPSLAAYGITGPLANPAVTLVRSSDQAVIATNDDWQTASNAAQLQAAGFAPPDAQEAALLVTLAPGAYTALVSGGTGVAVLGIYEVDQPQVRLINISTRGNVLTGNNVMIGGFIISGNAPQTVAIQGVGPSLSAYGITDPLANPTITLVRSSDQAILATNDDWETASNASALQAAGFAPTNPLESGLLVTLPPGAYTVILSGVNSTTGVGIIGIYTVD